MMLNKIIRKYFFSLSAFVLLFLPKVTFWKEKEKIWLIACGGVRWGDNADALFSYMHNEHPDIKTLAVVKKTNIPRGNKSNFIEGNKISSYVLILSAEVLATTHSLSDFGPADLIAFSKAKKIWLQHGVTGIKKITASNAKSGKFDLICVNSIKEKEVMENDLGVDPNLLAVTGFARHDVLKEQIGKSKNREGIFFLPTYRGWADKYQKDRYEKILFDWIVDLEKHDQKIDIKLWLHPGWYKRGLGELGKLISPQFRRFGLDCDPQHLLLNSRLLITDYSSVFFDAALSGIPTIFFQPDREQYIKEKGLFKDFLEQDQLLIVENKENLLMQIDAILRDKNYYKIRVAKDQEWAYEYVETFDGNSCRRIYKEIRKLLDS